MSKRWLRFLGAVCIALVSSIQMIPSQVADTIVPPNQDLDRAWELMNNSCYAEAEKVLSRVYEQNRGTPLAAAARMQMYNMAMLGAYHWELRSKYLQEAAAEVPVGSAMFYVIEIGGRIPQIGSTTERLRSLQDVIYSLGGPSLERILQTDDPYSLEMRPLSSIKASYQMTLLFSAYNSTADLLSEPQKISLRTYIRDRFPCEEGTRGASLRALQEAVLSYRKIADRSPFGDDTTPPVVQWKKPDRRGPVNPRGSIRLEVYDGDISQSQVDLSRLQFLVDGQDVRRDVTFRSVIDSSGLLGEEHIFERITVTYSPSASLSRGSHRLTVIVPDYGGFSTTSTLDVISEDDSN